MKVFNLRRAMRAALLLLLMTAGVTKVFADETFTVGYYKYYILSEADRTVSIGYDVYNNTFPNNFMAELPRTVTYQNVTYTVTQISGAGFWYCPQLLAISIPNTVTKIREYAFKGCENLQTVVIPNSVEDIEKCVFEDCPALQSAYWPENPDCWKIYNGTFRGCTGLLRYTFPENVTSIDMEAFKNCTSLEEITLSKTMNGIATHAFENCSSLRSVYSYRMDAPPTIVAETFKGAFAEGATIYVPYEALDKYQTEYWMNQHNYAWPASSNDITADMFEVIPADMFLTYTYFEDDARVEGAREGIAGDLVIPNTVRHNNEDFPVTDVAPWAFKNCNTLTSVVFPENMESILAEAFYDCDGLTMVDMSACTNMTHLGSYTFQRCDNLTTALLPPNLLILDYGVFSNCVGLTSIDLPNTLTTIGTSVFFNCIGLTSLTIPASVTTIEGSAFKYCNGLTEIYALRPTPPETNELAFWSIDYNIPVYVPYGSGDAYRAATGWSQFTNIQELPADIQYDYDEVNHTATVMGYGGAFSGSLEIPATVEYNNETYTVTAINASAFKNYYTMTNVTLPNTITIIGMDAFRGCRNATINIPESLIALGEGAFADCDHLTSVTLPEGLTSIPALAFYSCSALTEVHLPSTLTSIGIRAFGICTNLEIIFSAATTPPVCQVGNGNDTFLSVPSGCVAQVPFGYYNVYHTAPGWSSLNVNQGGFSYTMNEGITETIITGVYDNTFGDLVIPEMMNNRPTTTIVPNAFRNKSGITSLTLSSSMATIGAQAFADCSDLTAINVNANNANYTSVDGVLLSKDGKTLIAYPAGKTDANYSIPAGVENITNNAFEGAIVTSVNLPASLSFTTNFRNAFYGANHIASMTVDANHTNMKAVNGVLFSKDGTNLIYYPRGKAGQYNVPSGVTYILSHAFAECAQLSGITLNDELVSIEMYAFSKCTGLNTITLPAGITSINFATFIDCTNLKTVNFLGNISNIGSQAFRNTGLVSLTLPATVSDIGSYAFAQCTSLAEVTCEVLYLFIPSGENIFYGVDTYDIPLYVVASQVGNYASNQPWASFSVRPMPTPNGYLLYTWSDVNYTAHVAGVSDKQAISGDLVIPGTVKRNNGRTYTVIAIDAEAFAECANLTSVVIPHTVESIGTGAFYFCEGITELTIGRNVTAIYDYAFQGCSGLETIHYYPVNCQTGYSGIWNNCGTTARTLDIKNCVQSIPNNAFYNLKGLGNVTIPSSVTSIGELAFSQSGLTSVSLGSNVKTLGNMAFASSGLTSVDLQNVETLGNAAFYDCANLATLTLRNSQQTISESCFENCTSLNNVHIPSGVRTIGKQAFKGCTGLTNLVFDNPFQGQLTTISEEAFSGCGLTAVDIPNTVTTVGDWAFYGNTNLTTASIGTGMQYMGSIIFYNCTNLATIDYWATQCTYTGGWGGTGTGTKTLNIHNGVNYIPGSAFSGLILNEVTIPNGVTFIGEYAFAYCENLTEITIPNSVTMIGEAAFAGNQLATITLGSGLTSIGEYAFGTDESQQYLQTVTSYNVTPPTIFENTFNTGDYTNAMLYVLGEAAVTAYGSADYWQNFTNIQSMDGYYFTGATNSNWGLPANWSNGMVPTSDPLIEYIAGEPNPDWNPDFCPNVIILADATVDIPNAFANKLTIMDGNVVTVTNHNKLYIGNWGATYSAADASALVIKEGGSLWNSMDIQATAEKSIDHYTGSRNGWQFISSPLKGEHFDDMYGYYAQPDEIENMLEGNYDLYLFDQTQLDAEWQNYKANQANFEIRRGQGYLYANNTDVTLKFSGTIEANMDESGNVWDKEVALVCYNEQVEITDPDNPEITYYDYLPFRGWNLVGNPFAAEAYLKDNYSAVGGYYEMNAAGTALEAVETYSGRAIPSCTGIFLQANNENNVLFSLESPDLYYSTSNNGSLQIALEQPAMRGASEKIDNAIVSFNEGSKLEKFVLFQDNARIYIPQNGKDYAIVNTEPYGEMPINFVAPKSGQFTISVRPEAVPMSYLHLIDNLTGADTDLLENPSYTFEAKMTDYESRFKLVFICGDANDDNESFAFFNNGKLIVTNEGQATLQVIDINGRILNSERINGTVNVNINEVAGVYVLRLIDGENVKTQKIVVR